MLRDFLSLIYPHLCYACNRSLYADEQDICMHCRHDLPRTNFHRESENRVSKLFWGRASIEAATAYYYFDKGNRVQRLIHHLKYRGKTSIGQTIGTHFGHELQQASPYSDIDCLVPVPLHPRKRRKRGYNQSEFIALGLAEGMQKPAYLNALIRKVANPSQTRKSKFQRWQNVENIFAVRDNEQLTGKHVLLVDDVVTTGSTLEACAYALLQLPKTRVSVAAMACT